MVLPDASVSRRHAEVVRLPDGGLYVTDRASTNGTFVLGKGGDWHGVRQVALRLTDVVRFGTLQMTVGQLAAMCPSVTVHPDVGNESYDVARQDPTPREDGLDPNKSKIRDPETGEILDKETPPKW